jgi:23S rRNA pseudouridine1911/1915/1917 synthase
MLKTRKGSFSILVDEEDAGKRLDTLIALSFPELSRNSASRLIREGAIIVQNVIKKPGFKVHTDDLISGYIPENSFVFTPEPVDLDIIFEDPSILILNKQAGLVVHPSPGHDHGTLANGLLSHRPEIDGIGGISTRPGIVHRLDKDTSGIMVVAKTQTAFDHLIDQFKKRQIGKTYLGFVYGIPQKDAGQILLNIARHKNNRKKMATTDDVTARYAETHWKVINRFEKISLLEFDIKTGRTHQIRVHCSAIKHPIVGDLVYGLKRPYKPIADIPHLKRVVKSVKRQMLHAWRLGLNHPDTEERLQFEAPMPDDMAMFRDSLISLFNKETS